MACSLRGMKLRKMKFHCTVLLPEECTLSAMCSFCAAGYPETWSASQLATLHELVSVKLLVNLDMLGSFRSSYVLLLTELPSTAYGMKAF